MVKNPPANAGNTGSSPGLGRSHMPRVATTEARAPRARALQHEKPAHHNEEQPPLAATRESPCSAAKTQHSQK